MNYFILVTCKDAGRQSFIAINSIMSVEEQSDGSAYILNCFFVSSNLKRNDHVGLLTVESFSEVVRRIKEAAVLDGNSNI